MTRPASVSQKNQLLMRRKGARPTSSDFCSTATIVVRPMLASGAVRVS